jgi:thiamine-phosphate pyrophosphorylase
LGLILILPHIFLSLCFEEGMHKNSCKLILITNRSETSLPEYLSFIKICAESGITAVQLREKNASPEFLLEFGSHLKEILSPLQIPLIINDNMKLAIDLKASGIHLGQTDGDPNQTRMILGGHKIIGLSIETMAELYRSHHCPIDYVAASAVFPTTHKQDVKTLWGLERLSMLVKASKHPVVAIGGIDLSNAKIVMETGVSGIAIIGVLHQAKDPRQVTKQLRQIVDETVMGECT